jgi:hypothetical protein
MVVTGTGIPANTTISAVPDSTHITLSNNATATSSSTLTFRQKIDGTNFGFWMNSMPAGFDASGSLFVRSQGTSQADSREITYTSKSGNQFLGCNTKQVSTGEYVPGDGSVQRQVNDTNQPDAATATARKNLQATMVTEYYEGSATLPAGNPWEGVFARAVKSDLHIAFGGWFIFNNYAGHSGNPPANPINWAEYCGLRAFNETPYPSLATFSAVARSQPI